mgnify:CR=1 FL=1
MFAPGPVWLIVGRFLIGLGVAGSMMSGLKAARIWAPANRLPFITASLFAMTGVGGMVGTAPMGMLIAEIGWRGGLAAIIGYSALLWCLSRFGCQVHPGQPGLPGLRAFASWALYCVRPWFGWLRRHRSPVSGSTVPT